MKLHPRLPPTQVKQTPHVGVTNAKAQAGSHRTAVCISGAVRSHAETSAYIGLRDFLVGTTADLHYHLFCGDELSFRGQHGPPDPVALRDALGAAASVRIQMEENGYTCGQMSTGKWFKIESCARAVQAYASTRGIEYDTFVIMRPDLANYKRKLSSVIAGAWEGKESGQTWVINFQDEVLAMSYAGGIDFAANVTHAECCDEVNRSPKDCFIGGLKEPRLNWMTAHHFSPLGERHDNALATILRHTNFSETTRGYGFKRLHGKVRDAVKTSNEPAMSPLVHDWHLLGEAAQLSLLCNFLQVESGQCHAFAAGANRSGTATATLFNYAVENGRKVCQEAAAGSLGMPIETSYRRSLDLNCVVAEESCVPSLYSLVGIVPHLHPCSGFFFSFP